MPLRISCFGFFQERLHFIDDYLAFYCINDQQLDSGGYKVDWVRIPRYLQLLYTVQFRMVKYEIRYNVVGTQCYESNLKNSLSKERNKKYFEIYTLIERNTDKLEVCTRVCAVFILKTG